MYAVGNFLVRKTGIDKVQLKQFNAEMENSSLSLP